MKKYYKPEAEIILVQCGDVLVASEYGGEVNNGEFWE